MISDAVESTAIDLVLELNITLQNKCIDAVGRIANKWSKEQDEEHQTTEIVALAFAYWLIGDGDCLAPELCFVIL